MTTWSPTTGVAQSWSTADLALADLTNVTAADFLARGVLAGLTKTDLSNATTIKFILPSGDTTGVTDTANFQAAFTAGGYYRGKAGATYYVKARSRTSVNNTGFYEPTATIHMLTGSGNFDLATQADTANLWGSNHAAFDFDGGDCPIMVARFTSEAQTTPRACIPVAVRGCYRPFVDIVATNFAEAWGGLCAVSSCSGPGGYIRVVANGCTANTNTLPGLQVSAIECDNYRIDGVNSTGIHFVVRYKDFVLGALALARYGAQTDALNIQARGATTGLTWDVAGTGVGEAADIWCDGSRGVLNANNTTYFPVKLINGASNNQIAANIDGCGLSAVYFGDSSLQAGQHNHIEINAVNVCNAGSTYPGVKFDDNGNTYDPAYNYIHGSLWGHPDATMANAVGGGASGLGNVVELSAGNYSGEFSGYAATATGAPIIRQLNRGIVTYGAHTTATIAAGVITITSSHMQLDTEGASASDDLDTINGGKEGDIVVLRCQNNARNVVVKRLTGNIIIPADFTLNDSLDTITLLKSANRWLGLTAGINNN